MKKTLKKILLLSCAMAISTSYLAFAHSGRTDSAGGHRDNKNVSGLGSYHYHCGGYPAHLHPNGICPYSAPYVSTSSSVSTPKPVKHTPKLYGTDLKTYIKGKQIPTYCYKGDNSCEVIVAEDLEYYGYDINWVADWNTLYISRNDNKEITGVPISFTYSGQYISDIYKNNIVVRLTFADGQSYVPPSYSLNGRMIIPVDEMKCLGAFRYDSSENAVYID